MATYYRISNKLYTPLFQKKKKKKQYSNLFLHVKVKSFFSRIAFGHKHCGMVFPTKIKKLALGSDHMVRHNVKIWRGGVQSMCSLCRFSHVKLHETNIQWTLYRMPWKFITDSSRRAYCDWHLHAMCKLHGPKNILTQHRQIQITELCMWIEVTCY